MICAGLPREPLAHLPTPLEAAPRLSAALGVEVFVKREDLAGLCAGGNKARLMSFVIGALRARKVDALIAAAAAQSNKLREIAAAGARCGMRTVLLIPQHEDAGVLQGNRLLIDLLGAEVRLMDAGLDDAGVLAAQEAVREELAAAGHTPAVLDRRLDYGAEATLAYVDAAEELLAQLAEHAIAPDRVYLTAGAGMTVAGMALGLKHLGYPAQVVGVCVAREAAQLRDAVCGYASRAAARLGLGTTLVPGDVTLQDRYLGPGYGTVPPEVRRAVRFVAELHGMVLDPVYNGRTALALIDQAATAELPRGSSVVLVNTGGGPGIYPHNESLQQR